MTMIHVQDVGAQALPGVSPTSEPGVTERAAAPTPPTVAEGAVAGAVGAEAGRAAAHRITPVPSAPLEGAFHRADASAVTEIVVTGKPELRWYSGWDKERSNAWMKTAVTQAELSRISNYGMTRSQYNAMLASLYRPQSEQNLEARFNRSGEDARWPAIRAAMTSDERARVSRGEMTPAEAARVMIRANPGYSWMGTPAQAFTPVDWFPARDSGG